MFFHFIPNQLLYSVFLTQLPTPIPAEESMKDETPRTGILNFTHDYLHALYIIYMPPYKLFSTVRSYLLGLIKTFLHHGIFYRYNFTFASPFLCSTSLHLHLFLLGSHLYKFSVSSNITFFHRHTLCQQHKAITLSYFTLNPLNIHLGTIVA